MNRISLENNSEIQDMLKGFEAVLVELASSYSIKFSKFDIIPPYLNDPLSNEMTIMFKIKCGPPL